MKKILLICSTGMTSAFLVEKMKKVVQEKAIPVEIAATSDALSDEFIGKVNAVMLGPQVKYLLEKVKERFSTVPVDVIKIDDYSTLNVEKVLKRALEVLN